MKNYNYTHFYGVFFALAMGMSLGCPSQVNVYSAQNGAPENIDETPQEQPDSVPEKVLTQKRIAQITVTESSKNVSSRKDLSSVFGRAAQHVNVNSQEEESRDDSDLEENADDLAQNAQNPASENDDTFHCGVSDEDESLQEALEADAQRRQALLGDGGGAGREEDPLPTGVGAHRFMTVLIEVGESRFDENNLANLPDLIYGTQTQEGPLQEPSVNDKFRVDSYGQASIVGLDGEPGSEDDIFGPFHMDSLDCKRPWLAIQGLLDQEAETLNVAPMAEGARVLFIFSYQSAEEPCGYAGVAFGMPLSSEQLPDNFLAPIAISLTATRTHTIAHELGHTLGMGHTGIASCTGARWDNVPQAANSLGYYGDAECGSRTYADPFGFMGFGATNVPGITHSGAVAQEAWGWLRESEHAPHRIVQVEESGSYELQSLSEDHEPGVKALKMVHGQSDTNGWDPAKQLYVEYRTMTNADGSHSTDKALENFIKYDVSNFFEGALLHIGNPKKYNCVGCRIPTSFLFDPVRTGEDMPLWSDFDEQTFYYALPFGSSYVDPMTDTVVTLGHPGESGSVDVEIDLGRTDFDGPVVEDFYIDEEESTSCNYVVRGAVSDIRDENPAFICIEILNEAGDLEYQCHAMEVIDGEFAYPVDMRAVGSGYPVLIFFDDASNQQPGLAPDNVTDYWSKYDNPTLLRRFYDGEDIWECDMAGPEITDVEPANESVVTNPVVFNVNISDESALANASLQIRPIVHEEAGCALTTLFFDSFDTDLTSIEKHLEETLEPGNYEVIIKAEDIHGNTTEVVTTITVSGQRPFLRGDSNQDGVIDIADITHVTEVLFQGIGSFTCEDASDANDDGVVDLSDAQYISGYLFGGTVAEFPEPYQIAGDDPTEDTLGCTGYAVEEAPRD